MSINFNLWDMPREIQFEYNETNDVLWMTYINWDVEWGNRMEIPIPKNKINLVIKQLTKFRKKDA